MTGYRITVRGTPAPQGSKRAITNRHTGKPVVLDMAPGLKPWRDAVKAATMRAVPRGGQLAGPVDLYVIFWLPRPKTLPRSVLVPAKRPDESKLVRAVEDALTDGGAWKDDGQVVVTYAVKLYATAANPPGCTIIITELEDFQLEDLMDMAGKV